MRYWSPFVCQVAIILLSLALPALCQLDNELLPCKPEQYGKVLFNQTSTGQYIEYDVNVPTLNGFTLHYWINILRPTSLASTFSYLANKEENKDYVQVTILNVGESWYAVLQVNGIVVSNTPLPKSLLGEWHHLLHSWDGETGAWGIYFDGQLLEEGTSLKSKGLVVEGGGRVFSGQQASAALSDLGTTCSELGKFQEGVDGWLTLLALDTRAISRPSYWVNRMAVAVVASSCHTEHEGNVIGWVATPRRGYCGVLEARAANVCGKF